MGIWGRRQQTVGHMTFPGKVSDQANRKGMDSRKV